MECNRRKLLKQAAFLLLAGQSKTLFAAGAAVNAEQAVAKGNFDFIYNNAAYRDEFYPFLQNVFHLFPEAELHKLIHSVAKSSTSDEVAYRTLQAEVSAIKPFLGDITYSIPALSKQKKIIAGQTKGLLGDQKAINGYLEVGSTGRYLDSLEHEFNIEGDVYFLSEKPATYSPVDMIDRGQIAKAGKDLSLNNYQSNLGKHIPSGSIDVASVYIGFHHCPLNLREEFITSIRDSLRSNGSLILRDHDARDEKMSRVVALAHDVFNMGTSESWQYNHGELRNFYSLSELDHMLQGFGFKRVSEHIYQEGDPTRNALMRFQKA